MSNKMKNNANKSYLKTLFLSLLSLIIILILSFYITSVEQKNLTEKKKNLENAIIKSAIHCYSIEGVYPEKISYLEQNYNLKVDYDTFIVHYETFSSNILPDVTVIFR